MKKFIFTFALVILGGSLYAQDFVDNALLFSRTRPAGSARIQGIGGASVSLGGDYSSALNNPAGLGMFNRSEFTFSTAYGLNNISNEYLGTKSSDSRSVLNIPGLSLVLNFPSNKDRGYLGGSLGISLSRTNDFNQTSVLDGTNNNNSLVDYFIRDAGSTDPNNFLDNESYDYYSLTGLAYRNYLIEDRQDDLGYYYDSRLTFNRAHQREVSERKGAQYQWSFAYGANFSDKLFVGATLGVATLRFKLNQSFREDNLVYPEADTVFLTEFTTNENYDISGSGMNLTIGAIYRPVKFLQFGASLVTPTYYHIVDNYTASVASNWTALSHISPPNIYLEFGQPLVSEYNLSTPMKLSTGATFISKYGFISGDVEFLNYAKAKYSSDYQDDDFSEENGDIKAEYQRVINYKLGGEFRYEKYRVRAGYNFMANPIIRSSVNRSQQGFSAGLGYREKKFFIDFAATFVNYKARRIPYNSDRGENPFSDQKINNSNYIFTVGFPF